MISPADSISGVLQRLIEQEEFRDLLLLGTIVLQASDTERRQLEPRRKELEEEGRQLLKQARAKVFPNTPVNSRRPGGSTLAEAWYDDARFGIEALLDIAWRQFAGSPQWPYSNDKALGPREQTVREFQSRLQTMEETFANAELSERPPRQLLWIYDYCMAIFPSFADASSRGWSGRGPSDQPEPGMLPVPRRVSGPKKIQANIGFVSWVALLIVIALAALKAEDLYVFELQAKRAKAALEEIGR
ncbi:MAG: hypothetical protein U1A78_37870 [Polyangia bacterium]